MEDIVTTTLEALNSGSYSIHGNTVNIKDAINNSVKNSQLYTPAMLSGLLHNQKASTQGQTNIHVSRTSVIHAAEILKDENPVCLNFANATTPGGGFLTGAKAQEEAIARSTGLYPCLLACPEYYEANKEHDRPDWTDHMIYHPNVPVFRNDRGDWLAKPFLTNIITAPAPDCFLAKLQKTYDQQFFEAVFFSRTEKLLALIAEKKHSTLILGAWGAGAFGNDAAIVASIFKYHLDSAFQNVFDHVIFAIYGGNLSTTQAFLNVFPNNCSACIDLEKKYEI